MTAQQITRRLQEEQERYAVLALDYQILGSAVRETGFAK